MRPLFNVLSHHIQYSENEYFQVAKKYLEDPDHYMTMDDLETIVFPRVTDHYHQAALIKAMKDPIMLYARLSNPEHPVGVNLRYGHLPTIIENIEKTAVNKLTK